MNRASTITLIVFAALLMLVAVIHVAQAQTLDINLTQLVNTTPPARAVLVWTYPASQKAYTAGFIGDDYVVVFTSHGDVSLNGRYISTCRTAYVYRVATGELVATLSEGTYRVESLDPFNVTKIWDRCGYFSGDARKLLEDPNIYGLDARVVDLTTLKTIVIDWNLPPDTSPRAFYAAQMNGDGSIFVVGLIANGTVIKYELVGGKYVPTWKWNETGNFGRRLQLTLDGRILIVGGYNCPVVDLFIGWKLADRLELPDPGGATALGIDDPFNPKYVIIGTANGWVIIAKIENGKFKVVYQAQHPTSWFYNPFYNRYIPRTTELFALASLNGYVVFYDPLTNTASTYTLGCSIQCSAVAISPSGDYIFAGRGLFVVERRDQFTGPRLRAWGTLTLSTSIETDKPIVVKLGGGNLFAHTGVIRVKKLWVEPIPVSLVGDKDVRNGNLIAMYQKGLITPTVDVKYDWVEKQAERIVMGGELTEILRQLGEQNTNRYLAVYRSYRFVPPPYFWEGTAATATVIEIPLKAPLSLFDKIYFDTVISAHTETVMYDKTGRALALLGVPVSIGVPASGTIASTRVAYEAARLLLFKLKGFDVSTMTKAAMIQASKQAAKLAGIVGVAIFAWSAIDAALVEWGGLGDIKIGDMVVVAPVVVDDAGNKYVAAEIYLPLEAAGEALKWKELVTKVLSRYGIPVITESFLGTTWDEYENMLRAGLGLRPSITSIIYSTLPFEDVSRMKIEKIIIVIANVVKAKETFWEWLFGLGGLNLDTVTLISALKINVKGILAQFSTTDPAEIASILGGVIINGQEYRLLPSNASTPFKVNGTNTVVIKFKNGKPGYYVDVDVQVEAALTVPFKPVVNDTAGLPETPTLKDILQRLIGFNATLTYNLETPFRVKRYELLDMWCAMKKLERISVIPQLGRTAQDITDLFELTDVHEDPASPTGQLYYYATIANLDQIGFEYGNVFYNGTRITFTYYCAPPPDAWISLDFESGSTATLPHAAIVEVGSTIDQNVTYKVEIELVKQGNRTKVYEWRFSGFICADCYNTTRINLAPYIDLLLNDPTAMLIISAEIVDAKYNFIHSNDFAYRMLLAPSTVYTNNTYPVVVKVLDCVTGDGIPGANVTVTAINGPVVASATTDNIGLATLVLKEGKYDFTVSAIGYDEETRTITVNKPLELTFQLCPVGYIIPPIPPLPTLPEPRTPPTPGLVLARFKVYDATTGDPLPNATVVIIEANTGIEIATLLTDENGTAETRLAPDIYNVSVTATGYEPWNKTILIDRDTTINVPLVPISAYNESRAWLTVKVVDANEMPVDGAIVEVYIGTLLQARGKTDFTGTVEFYLQTGYEYEVVMKAPMCDNYVSRRTVYLVNDTNITFQLPCALSEPPEHRNYTIRFIVKSADGVPLSNVKISAYEANETRLVKVVYTDDSGHAEMVLPGPRVYIISVYAVHPVNTTLTWSRNYTILLDSNRILYITVPWYINPPEQRYLIKAYVYNAVTNKPIPYAIVYVLNSPNPKTADMWIGNTSKDGWATIIVPEPGMYYVYATHPDYKMFNDTIPLYIPPENKTVVVKIPMVPKESGTPPTPPVNSCRLAPFPVNGTYYRWLSVQVIYEDGYPFEGALVQVYNSTGALVFNGTTDSTGFVHILIPNGTETYTVHVEARNATGHVIYSADRTVNGTCYWWLVFTVPEKSPAYKPEVLIQQVILAGSGISWANGPVKVLVLTTVWTNVEQSIDLEVTLYRLEDSNKTNVTSAAATVQLERGSNVVPMWLEISAPEGGSFQACSAITSFEEDTNPNNNMLCSNVFNMTPYVDLQVLVVWRLVSQRATYAILPGDVIQLSIIVKSNIKLTKAAKLHYTITMWTPKNPARKIRDVTEDLVGMEAGSTYRNITMTVPYTPEITISVRVDHPWEKAPWNNEYNVTIDVDPDAIIKVISAPTLVREGTTFTVKVNVTVNAKPGEGKLWVMMLGEDNKLLAKKEVDMMPTQIVELEAKAPDIPGFFLIGEPPTKELVLNVTVAGDAWDENNDVTVKVTVAATSWFSLGLLLLALIAVIGLLLALKAILSTVREPGGLTRFVKKRSRRFVNPA